MSTEGSSHVRDLKASLRSLHGFPVCMQQLLCDGNPLDNSAEIDSATDLELVLIAPANDMQWLEAQKLDSC